MTPLSHSDPVAYINDARATVADVRAALIEPSPDRLFACLPALEEAARRLGVVESIVENDVENTVENIFENTVENSWPAEIRDSGEVACALKALKSELRGVSKLIEQGAVFYRGWARLLGAAAAGYTPSGEAAPLVARGSVALDG